LHSILGIPDHITPVAYLCLGYVNAFSKEPDLERAGWEKRTPLKSVLSLDQYDSDWGEGGRA
jgi:5,6-dimethylbenzimidazole synthase